MKIAVIPSSPNHLGNRLFTDTNVRDDILAPYREIKRAAEEQGWSMATFDQFPLNEVDKVLAFNFEAFPEAILSALDAVGRANMIAIVREPPEIAPIYYDQDIQRCFGAFYLAESTLPDNRNSFYLGFPVSPVDVDWIPFEAKKLLVSITSAHFTSFEGSLYEERVKAIKHFQASLPEEFDMFGQGWKKNTLFPGLSPHKVFPSYKGTISSKHEAMGKYKFSLCYENSNNVYGYVSEKILDSLRCGCVPIYLGAPDIQKYIPKACFIDRREFGSDREVEQFILNVSKERYGRYLDGIRGYLNSESYLDRLPDRYAQRIISFVEKEMSTDCDCFSIEGQRKLRVFATMKKIRRGSLKDKCSGGLLLVKYGRPYDWAKLAKEIIRHVTQKVGVPDLITWIRIRRIRPNI
jgi:hypothetical protein